MRYLIERLKHFFRYRHKRGHGVHSPFMFHLILNVLRDRKKHYTYPDYPSKKLSRKEKIDMRLCFRLTHYFQPKIALYFGTNIESLAHYSSIYHTETKIVINKEEHLPHADFICFGTNSLAPIVHEFSSNLRCILIFDIHKKGNNRNLWLHYRPKARVSVDMMNYGLLLFDPKIQVGYYNLMIS